MKAQRNNEALWTDDIFEVTISARAQFLRSSTEVWPFLLAMSVPGASQAVLGCFEEARMYQGSSTLLERTVHRRDPPI
jgi:hypothetical protein